LSCPVWSALRLRSQIQPLFSYQKEAVQYVAYLHKVYKSRIIPNPPLPGGQLTLFQEVSNESKEVREQLKELGFCFSGKPKMGRAGKETLDEIRSRKGSQKVEKQEPEEKALFTASTRQTRQPPCGGDPFVMSFANGGSHGRAHAKRLR
jgi:hypothetical protein